MTIREAVSLQGTSEDFDKQRREQVTAASAFILDLVGKKPGMELSELVRALAKAGYGSAVVADALSELLYEARLELSDERALRAV